MFTSPQKLIKIEPFFDIFNWVIQLFVESCNLKKKKNQHKVDIILSKLKISQHVADKVTKQTFFLRLMFLSQTLSLGFKAFVVLLSDQRVLFGKFYGKII